MRSVRFETPRVVQPPIDSYLCRSTMRIGSIVVCYKLASRLVIYAADDRADRAQLEEDAIPHHALALVLVRREHGRESAAEGSNGEAENYRDIKWGRIYM